MKLKSLLNSLIGMNLLTFGLNLIIHSQLGVSPFDTVCLSIAALSGITMGDASLIFHLLFTCFCLILMRRVQFSITEILFSACCVFISTRLIDLYAKTMPFFFDYLSPVAFFSLGFLMFSYGLAVMIHENRVITPVDKFSVAGSLLIRCQPGTFKLYLDLFLLIVALLLIFSLKLEIPLALGTVIITVGAGPMVNVYERLRLTQLF